MSCEHFRHSLFSAHISQPSEHLSHRLSFVLLKVPRGHDLMQLSSWRNVPASETNTLEYLWKELFLTNFKTVLFLHFSFFESWFIKTNICASIFIHAVHAMYVIKADLPPHSQVPSFPPFLSSFIRGVHYFKKKLTFFLLIRLYLNKKKVFLTITYTIIKHTWNLYIWVMRGDPPSLPFIFPL